MSNINEKCLEVFPAWLRSMGADVEAILAALKQEGTGAEARRALCGGVNYLFKSLDLIPDGIDDIGYLDDAFVLRISCRDAIAAGLGAVGEELETKLGALAADADLIKEFLGKDIAKRFQAYVLHLTKGAARGRSVDDIMESPEVFKEFATEVATFVEQFTAPSFSKDEKNLVKLKAFFEAKLPK